MGLSPVAGFESQRGTRGRNGKRGGGEIERSLSSRLGPDYDSLLKARMEREGGVTGGGGGGGGVPEDFRSRVLEAVRANILFAELNEEVVLSMLGVMELVEYSEGEVETNPHAKH